MATEARVELDVLDKAIHCAGCENRIQTVLSRVPGVRAAKADHRTQKVAVTIDAEKTSVEEVLERLERIGFPARKP